MRLIIAHSLALGLASLTAVEASVCKPRSLSSAILSIESTTQIVTTTTETAAASGTTEVSITTTTTALTTSLDLTETTSEQGTTASTEVTVITESTVTTEAITSSETLLATETTEAPTTTAVTTTETAAATTTTVEPEPRVTTFKIIFHESESARSQTVYSNQGLTKFLFDDGSLPGASIAYFSVDPEGGNLLLNNDVPVCASFEVGTSSGVLRPCSSPINAQEVATTCDMPRKDGDALKCSAPELSCVNNDDGDAECERTGVTYTMAAQFFHTWEGRYGPALRGDDFGMSFKVSAV